MTTDELRKALLRSGRSIRRAAREMGIHPRTLHRYLSGEVKVPKLVELVVLNWMNHVTR